MWDCGTANEIVIAKYRDNPDFYIVEYTDTWSLPSLVTRPVGVSIKCQSLHVAKLMGDKAAKECRAYWDRLRNESDDFLEL